MALWSHLCKITFAHTEFFQTTMRIIYNDLSSVYYVLLIALTAQVNLTTTV